jgi:photosystem II stability/assembly factor-like uncharacterized protein
MRTRAAVLMRGAVALILGAALTWPMSGARTVEAAPSISTSAGVRLMAAAPVAGVYTTTIPSAAHEDAFSFNGTRGASRTMYLQGGRYVLLVSAMYPPFIADNNSTCVFGATLDGIEHPVPGNQGALGALTVGNVIGYHYMPTLNLPAGHYTLHVAALTDCNWAVTIGGGGSGHPFASFDSTGIFHMLAGQNEKTTIVETTNKRYTFGFAYNAWGDGFNVPTATMDTLQDGRVLRTYKLSPTSGDYGQTAFGIDLTFPPGGGAKLGVYTARYNIVVGGKTFSKSVRYRVQDLAPGTWTRQSSGTAVDLGGLSCASVNMCVSVAKGGMILATTDGKTWSRRATPLGNDTAITLSNVSCPSMQTCYAVGAQYYILGSKDGGLTWSVQSGDDTFTSFTQDFISVRCPTERRCYAVGRGGIIAATDDGGARWALQAKYGSGKDLSDVDCPTASTCIAVGQDGTILRTTNGGTTWQRQAVGTAYLFSVDCPTAGDCFATGQQGTILHSGNGGVTWTRQNNPFDGTQLWVDSVSCSSAMLCHAVGNMGNLLITTDGGTIWRDQVTPVHKQLNVVSCAGTQACYAIGNGGTIVKGA